MNARTVVPPHSLEAEQAVLGALMLDERALLRVQDWLLESDFYRRDHQLIYRAISELAACGKPFDAVTLGEWFESQGHAEQVGGSAYVLELASTTPSAANVVAYGEIVIERSRFRQLMDIGSALADAAAAPSGRESRDLVAHAMAKLGQFSPERAGGLVPIKAAAKAFATALIERYESQAKFSGRLTPWHDVNELTLGLKPADLIVVAGRPGMGKSVAGFGLATFDALRGGRPAVFSLEMSAEQFVEREIAAIGEIPHAWLRNPDKHAEEADAYWARSSRAIQDLVGSQLLIDDAPALTIEQIAARSRRAHLQAPLTMVVIDHLHIVRLKGGENTVRELGDVSRGAKKLAKELRCPVVLLAQLNRGNEQRADKRPTMADLRGSGEIEQDADYILLLHREDYYDESSYAAGMMEVIVGKARNARRQNIALRSRLDQMRFDDWEGALPVPPERAKPARAARGFSSGADRAAGARE
jgi:replicative DNA helicase